MTKQEIMDFLEPIGWDEEVYMLDGRNVVPVCIAESEIDDVDFGIEGEEDIQKVAVLAPCRCHQEETSHTIDIDINLN